MMTQGKAWDKMRISFSCTFRIDEISELGLSPNTLLVYVYVRMGCYLNCVSVCVGCGMFYQAFRLEWQLGWVPRLRYPDDEQS